MVSVRSTPGVGLVILASLTMVEAFDNKFLFPNKRTTYHYNDVLQVQWQSNFTDPILRLYCVPTDSNDLHTQYQESAPSNNGTQEVELGEWSTIVRCWFNMRNDKATMEFNSENMDYDPSPRDTTDTIGLSTTITSTTASASASATASTTSAATTSATSPSSPTSTNGASSASSDSSNSSELSTGAKAGIGAGVGGAALLAIIAIIFWFLRRNGKNAAANEKNSADFNSSHGSDGNAGQGHSYPASYNAVPGASGTGSPVMNMGHGQHPFTPGAHGGVAAAPTGMYDYVRSASDVKSQYSAATPSGWGPDAHTMEQNGGTWVPPQYYQKQEQLAPQELYSDHAHAVEMPAGNREDTGGRSELATPMNHNATPAR